MQGGYVGKILRVDLTSGAITEENLPPEGILRQYVGGTGLAMKILNDELAVRTKPLDPDNRLIFMTGPLTGTPYPCSSDTSLVTLNANTGYTVGDSHTHGFFGAFLKFAGYDGLIIQGAAKKPVYLWVYDGEVEIRDAAEFWGKETHETEDLIKAVVGTHNVSVAAIGPAGENLIHGSGIENDKYHMVAKAGVGAVMGSKKLKAIALKGSGVVPVADPSELLKVVEEWHRIAFTEGHQPELYRAGVTRAYDKNLGDQDLIACKNMLSPILGRKWARGIVDGCKQFKITPTSCWSCPVACAYRSEITFGPHRGYVATLAGGGENMEGAAGIIGIMDPGTVHYLTDMNDRLGVDSSDVGVCLGLAFELYERGLLNKHKTDGLELEWGNAEAAEALLHKIVRREGFGKIFAEGPKKAAETFGGNAPRYVIHIKGTGYNLHDWRRFWGIMLGQITAGAGPCWQGGFGNDFTTETELGYPSANPPFTKEGLAKAVTEAQMRRVWDDCYGQCWLGNVRILMETPGAALLVPRAIRATVGWPDFSFDEAITVGHRVITLERIFNMKRGLTIESDLDIGPRLLEAPTEGKAKGKSLAPYLRELITEFYEHMGWDKESGKPTQQTLKKLGLKEAAKGL